ncbi:MAG TPA: T9SS type A sorting domain-containing protein [Saprospiraceae bacterium]|nr:T9SS type A sorting domain-containing protein [Saprospiraceae bacterium]
MKIRLLLTGIVCVLIVMSSYAQFETHELKHDGRNRTYYVHVPAVYDASKPASIVIWLHGMGSISVKDVQKLNEPNLFVPVSDTANFLLLVPVAEDSGILGIRAWNSLAGIELLGISPNSNVDDIGFMDAMLDEIIGSYTIDENRIFVCGFSMGGFMTQRLALERNERYAAYASVSGTIGSNIKVKNPGKAIRLAHFHGTSDQTVGYAVNSFGMTVDAMIDFWTTNNQTDKTYTHHEVITDTDPVSGKSIETDHYIFSNGKEDIVLYKQNNIDHVWLTENNLRIWDFFRNTISTVSTYGGLNDMVNFKIYPNPAHDFLNIEIPGNENIFSMDLYDVFGRLMMNTIVSASYFQIPLNTSPLKPGIYIVRLKSRDTLYTSRIVIE